MSTIITKKNINTIKKITNIIIKINKIDEILNNKCERNTKNLELCNSLLENTNNNFFIIIKNLK